MNEAEAELDILESRLTKLEQLLGIDKLGYEEILNGQSLSDKITETEKKANKIPNINDIRKCQSKCKKSLLFPILAPKIHFLKMTN